MSMSLADRLRGLLYPLAILLAIVYLWVHAWSASLEEQISPTWYPANDPGLIDRVTADLTSAQAMTDLSE